MIETLKDAQEKALKEGYSGLRVTGEMSWSLKKIKGKRKLIEYEAKLNNFFLNSKSTALCQYHENSFNRKILVEVIHTHPLIGFFGKLYQNKYYYSPAIFIKKRERMFPDKAYNIIKEDITTGI